MSSVECESLDLVQKFIDYLYTVKSSEMLAGIDKQNLETFYIEYLDSIKQTNSCGINNEQLYVVDRTSFFNAISYIVNNYSTGVIALQDKHSEWVTTDKRNTLIVYHKLSIKSYLQNVAYETEVDRCDCYPTEKESAIVNYGRQTNINYFELKDLIYPVLSSNSCCCKFMELIEDRFNDTKVLTDIDINEFLDSLKKEYPRKVKKL